MKQYSFKLYDQTYIDAMDRWIENGYEIRGIVEELLRKYEGLQLPKPSEIQDIHIELKRQNREIEALKKDASEMVDILISLTKDMEKLSAQCQPPPLTTTYPIATG